MAGSPPVEQDVRREVPGGTVTFLFTDIESSTKLLERLRGEYATLLTDHGEILRSIFVHWNGHEVDTQGDAFFVTFSRATDAVACVIAAQRALAAHRWPQGASVRVRMGLHTGEALISNSKYVGMDVHLGARIASAGHGGQVLLSQSTRSLIDRDLPRGATLRDLGPYELKDIRRPQQIYQLDIAGLPSDFPALMTLGPVDQPPLPGEPPFKGLQYFDEGDAELFFGREQVTATLVGDLRDHRFLAVVGASGSGKSSVVRAGLVPALRQGTATSQAVSAASRWRIEIITPGAHPLEALAASLTRGSESVTATATLIDDLARDARSLHLFARRDVAAGSNVGGEGRAGARLLLVVDQFEELFTLCRNEAERRAFVDNVVYAVEAEGGATTAVISLRADFYPHLSQFDRLRALVAKHQEYIGPMSAAELRRAMEEPARRGGWEFNPGLVDLLLHDIGAVGEQQPEPGALPLLSHALLEMWRRRRGDVMTFKGYAEAGGVHGAIAQTAERVYNQELTPEQQTIARTIFLRLTELGEGTQDTRRRVARSELIPPAPSSDAAQVEDVLVKLIDARLITTGEGTVEVAHEALIREWPALREWLAQNREGLRLQRRLTEGAQEWERLGRDAGALYRGARLVQAQEWAMANPQEPNLQEWAFLDASKAQAEADEAQREAHRVRELEAAQKLAEAERQRAEAERRRAEEQVGAAQKLRRRAAYLVGVLVLAMVLAVTATGFAYQANQNERLASDAANLTFVRELSGTSVNSLDVDPERSILLALQAIAASSSGGRPVIREAEEALHRAVQTSRILLTLREHTNRVVGVAFSPDGTRLATTSLDKTARVFDASTGRSLLTLTGHTDEVIGVAFRPDGRTLATASSDKTAKIWDASTGKELLTLVGHTEALRAVAFSPDGTRLATASNDRTAKVWDAETGKALLTLDGHTDLVRGVAFSPDGMRLATGSNDKTAKVWDAATGKELRTLSGHTDLIAPVSFSPDGTRIATGGFDGTTKIWDAASGQQLSSLRDPNLASQNAIAFNKAGTRLATCTGGNVAAIWDLATEQIEVELRGHTSALSGCAFSPDPQGMRLATTSNDSTARVWDASAAGSREWLTFAGHVGGVYENRVRGIAYSPDGRYLASASFDRTAKIWDATTGKELLTLAGHTDALRAVAFSPDGKHLATISDDLTARVWDASTGQVLFTRQARALVQGLTDHSVAFSPDGKRLAIESDGNAVKVWDATSGQELLTLSGHTKFVHSVAYSPDGTRLATASNDGTAKMWDAVTGKELLTLTGHKLPVYDIGFSPDGMRLVTASQDGTAKLWDAITGKELGPLAVGGIVFAASFSPDGVHVATASSDSTVKLWNVSPGTEQRELTLLGHTAAVYDVAFSPDGRRLATASKDGTARVYALPIDDLVTIAKSRLTRDLTTDECEKFLHVAQCPVAP